MRGDKMKFKITSTNECSKYTKEINSLEELLAFSKELDEPLIIFSPEQAWLDSSGLPVIEIYDGYRE